VIGLKPSAIFAVFLVGLCLLSIYPAVEAAQATKVIQVSGPTSVIAGSLNPIPLTTTVRYDNTVTGYLFVVAILDAGLSPQRPVPGFVASSTDPCLSESEAAAICAIPSRAGSGVESIAFQIGGIFGGRRGPGKWDLNVTSAVFDTHNNPVPGSMSSTIFEITLVPVALNVAVPSGISISVDGVQQPAGPVSMAVALGQHNLTAPQLVNESQFTRLRFDHWSDGYPAAFRKIVVTNNTSLEADYVTQNLLTIIDPTQNATTTTWYDADTNATFSANQYEPAPGMFGAMGVRLSFQGWYEGGQLLTNSPTGTIAMDKPHTLTTVWQLDYVIPITVMLLIVAALILIMLVLRRKNPATKGRSSRPRTRRKRS